MHASYTASAAETHKQHTVADGDAAAAVSTPAQLRSTLHRLTHTAWGLQTSPNTFLYYHTMLLAPAARQLNTTEPGTLRRSLTLCPLLLLLLLRLPSHLGNSSIRVCCSRPALFY